jgi:hypothetical protein
MELAFGPWRRLLVVPGMSRVTWSVHNALTRWQWSPFSLLVLFLLVGAAVWYLKTDWILASRGRRWPSQRTVYFMLGLVAVDLALQSPVATRNLHSRPAASLVPSTQPDCRDAIDHGLPSDWASPDPVVATAEMANRQLRVVWKKEAGKRQARPMRSF